MAVEGVHGGASPGSGWDSWLQSMFDISPVGMALADHTGVLVLANPAYCSVLGRSFEELVGRSSREFTHPDDLAQHAAVEQMMAVVEVGDAAVQLEKRYLHPDGSVRWAWVSVAYVPAACGVQWTMATVHDITDRRRSEDLLRTEAETDPLTGLWNRRGWSTQMQQLLATREPTQPLTIAMLDLDHFKAYNERHGHHAGDTLLQGFGARASAALRHGDVLARWGGEEFALALPGCGPEDATTILGLLARVVPGRAELLRRVHHHAGRGEHRRHLGPRRHPAVHRQTPGPAPRRHRPPHPLRRPGSRPGTTAAVIAISPSNPLARGCVGLVMGRFGLRELAWT